MKTENNNTSATVQASKRAMLGFGAAAVLSPIWIKPVINAVVLPAHAQTSANMCITDATVGGPLVGNASGATTCQAACEAEAVDLGAQLCEVREVDTPSGIDCACDIDTM